MKEPIIVVTKAPDQIVLEGILHFQCAMTLGLADKGDFYLVIEFNNLTMEELKLLAQLTKLPKALSIKSKVVSDGEYNISHIVITNFSVISTMSMTWECLSDDPNFSLEL